MSFARRFELPAHTEDVDLSCQTCKHTQYDFECGQIGYCIEECGEVYVVSSLLNEKGYGQVNLDWVLVDGEYCEGIELYNRECKKLAKNLKQLGYNVVIRHHPMQKKYLSTVFISSHRPIELCHIFMKLDVIT